jgi:hypothetical protein
MTHPGCRLDALAVTTHAGAVRALRRWIGIALLAPMLVLAVSASSFLGMRCRMSGLVTADACGPEGAPASQGPAQTSLGEPGCCERVVVETVKPIGGAAPEVDAALHAPVAFSGSAPRVDAAPSSRVERVAAEGGPPRRSRPSLCLLNRSLLL